MGQHDDSAQNGASARHQRTRDLEQSHYERREGQANRISTLRLLLFGAAAVLLYGGWFEQRDGWASAGLFCVLGFAATVVWHARVLSRRHAHGVRRDVHQRQIDRIAHRWEALPDPTAKLHEDACPGAQHPYASDIDLLGEGSLLHRLFVGHTRPGLETLLRWLGEAEPLPSLRERQAAVRELWVQDEFREDLEVAAATHRTDAELLDPSPFLALESLPRLFEQRPWLKLLILLLPCMTISAIFAANAGLVPGWTAWVGIGLQLVVIRMTGAETSRWIELVTSRGRVVESFEQMLALVEAARLRTEKLGKLTQALQSDGVPAYTQLRRLRRYEGLAQMRRQGPLYLVANTLLLWDLWCVLGLERFVRQTGGCRTWFEALGELEALCSLANLAATDPLTCFPELEQSALLEAKSLAHPLLPPGERVPNDLTIDGPGQALLITGSNMAGKSTLLRALGCNVALALAGGPCCAQTMRIGQLRMRASMRIDDSLQRGASYFKAELDRLQAVVANLDEAPPVLFLLDELLRGTNAGARHTGARAVIRHLLGAGSLGIIATHDLALTSMEQQSAGAVRNLHFTDVFENGEMRFDYTLRPGAVKGSNALLLLRMAGIAVPEEESPAAPATT